MCVLLDASRAMIAHNVCCIQIIFYASWWSIVFNWDLPTLFRKWFMTWANMKQKINSPETHLLHKWTSVVASFEDIFCRICHKNNILVFCYIYNFTSYVGYRTLFDFFFFFCSPIIRPKYHISLIYMWKLYQGKKCLPSINLANFVCSEVTVGN